MTEDSRAGYQCSCVRQPDAGESHSPVCVWANRPCEVCGKHVAPLARWQERIDDDGQVLQGHRSCVQAEVFQRHVEGYL